MTKGVFLTEIGTSKWGNGRDMVGKLGSDSKIMENDGKTLEHDGKPMAKWDNRYRWDYNSCNWLVVCHEVSQ
jgi:hypothetical protein